MLSKVTIKQIWRGKQLVKKGTPDEKEIDKVSIKTNEHGDSWLTTFKVQGTEDLKESMTVSLDIIQKGEYFNFTMPSEVSKALEARFVKLENAVFGGATGVVATQKVIPEEVPSEEGVNPEDIPF